jgi:hypothetical protein
MWIRHVQNATHYAEYGSGGSTVVASTIPTLRSILSIESDAAFAHDVRASSAGAVVRWVDVGRTGGYGHPVDESKKDEWPSYSAQTLGTPDLVLVDGRWRVACICHVLKTYPNATLLVHDFSHRSEYHVVLELADIVETTESLVSLARKPATTDRAIDDLYERHKYEQA